MRPARPIGPSRGRVAWLIALALVVALSMSAAACDFRLGRRVAGPGEASPSPAMSLPAGATPASPATTCHQVPVGVEFDYRGTVPKSERAEVKHDSLLARKYYGITTDSCARDTVFVFVYGRADKHAVALTRGASAIQIFRKSRGWFDATSTDRAVVLLHEWYHVVQARVTTVHESSLPAWIIEGTAVWSSERAAADLGFYASYATPRAEQLRDASLATISLKSWRRFVSGAYPLAFAAIDYLVGPSKGKAKARLFTFFTMVGQGTSWLWAFRQVFGMTVQRFYSTFAAYRANGFIR